MLKALLKKQLLELGSAFFKDRRTGKRRSRASFVLFVLMFALIFVGIGSMFFMLGKTIATTASDDMMGLYYFVMGLIAIALGILGSVFNTYFSVFDAKDNELLLSLPIPPAKIVLVRVFSVAIMAALYEAIVLIPAFLARVIYRKVTVLCVVNTLLLSVFVTAFVVALSIALGFVVAAIVRKVKSKTVFTVAISIIMLALYYFLYFKAQSAVMKLIQLTTVPEAIKKWMFPFYHMGLAAEGNPLSMLIFSAISAGLFVVAYALLTKNYIRFSTAKKSASAKAKKGKIRMAKVGTSLLVRELKRYGSSPNYILNCSFGTLMMLVAGVFFFIKGAAIRNLTGAIGQVFPKSSGLILAAAIVCMLSSGNDLTAPSVTLEGNRIWILLSLPIRTEQVFIAKIAMHVVLTVVPVLFVSAAALYAIGASALSCVFMILLALSFMLFTAEYGLVLNLIKPDLKWTSEVVALKQSPSVLISVFSEYLFLMALLALYLWLGNYMWDGYYVLILAFAFAAVDAGLAFWLKKVGVKKFRALG